MLRRPAIVLLLLLLSAGCTGDGEGPGVTRPAPSEASAVASTASESPSSSRGRSTEPATGATESEDSSTVTANPAAKVKGKCTREPQPGEVGEELVADLRVVNTGNLGVVVRVSSRWPIGEDEGILRWSRVRVKQGESMPLTLRIPVDTEIADGVRKALAKERRCHVRSRVTGAFGVPEG